MNEWMNTQVYHWQSAVVAFRCLQSIPYRWIDELHYCRTENVCGPTLTISVKTDPALPFPQYCFLWPLQVNCGLLCTVRYNTIHPYLGVHFAISHSIRLPINVCWTPFGTLFSSPRRDSEIFPTCFYY